MAAAAIPPGVLDRIIEVLEPEEAWLFGSRARETHGPDSDWDANRKKPIAKLLTAAGLDLDAARRLLTDPPNVLAAHHLQQAAEKIISAVRLHRGLLNTKDHDLPGEDLPARRACMRASRRAAPARTPARATPTGRARRRRRCRAV